MKERGILFSSAMVRALLDGTKTNTRRVIVPQPPTDTRRVYPIHSLDFSETTGEWVREWMNGNRPWTDNRKIKCPFGKPGDRLWVRETYFIDHYEFYPGGKLPKTRPQQLGDGQLLYRADGTCCEQLGECQCEGKGATWRTPIYMPRWASRMTLEILTVSVERVQEIDTEDCIAEGVTYPVRASTEFPGKCSPVMRISGDYPPCDYMPAVKAGEHWTHEQLLRAHFASLWDSINAKREDPDGNVGGYSWEKNPWVWVVEFRRCGITSSERQAA